MNKSAELSSSEHEEIESSETETGNDAVEKRPAGEGEEKNLFTTSNSSESNPLKRTISQVFNEVKDINSTDKDNSNEEHQSNDNNMKIQKKL
jgi:hypothetical protein